MNHKPEINDIDDEHPSLTAALIASDDAGTAPIPPMSPGYPAPLFALFTSDDDDTALPFSATSSLVDSDTPEAAEEAAAALRDAARPDITPYSYSSSAESICPHDGYTQTSPMLTAATPYSYSSEREAIEARAEAESIKISKAIAKAVETAKGREAERVEATTKEKAARVASKAVARASAKAVAQAAAKAPRKVAEKGRKLKKDYIESRDQHPELPTHSPSIGVTAGGGGPGGFAVEVNREQTRKRPRSASYAPDTRVEKKLNAEEGSDTERKAKRAVKEAGRAEAAGRTAISDSPAVPLARRIPPAVPLARRIPPAVPLARRIPPAVPLARRIPPAVPFASRIPQRDMTRETEAAAIAAAREAALAREAAAIHATESNAKAKEAQKAVEEAKRGGVPNLDLLQRIEAGQRKGVESAKKAIADLIACVPHQNLFRASPPPSVVNLASPVGPPVNLKSPPAPPPSTNRS